MAAKRIFRVGEIEKPLRREYDEVKRHHNESPPCGRSAVAAEECGTPFAVNMRREFEKCKPRYETR
jgi:hypothetical protein